MSRCTVTVRCREPGAGAFAARPGAWSTKSNTIAIPAHDGFDASGDIVLSPTAAMNLETMVRTAAGCAAAVDLARFAASFDDPVACPIHAPASSPPCLRCPKHCSRGLHTGDFYYACGWMVRDAGVRIATLAHRRPGWNVRAAGAAEAMIRPTGASSTTSRRPPGLDNMAIDLRCTPQHCGDILPDHELFGEYLRRECSCVVEEGK